MNDFVTANGGELHKCSYKTGAGFEWHCVRRLYAAHRPTFENAAQVRASLRAGPYVFPGGYPVAYITDDGGTLCPDCVMRNYYLVCWAIRNQCTDGWRVIASEYCDGESDAHCDNCAAPIA